MKTADAAVLFRAMADRLDSNASVEFGGAFLVVPPGEEPMVIDGITVSTQPNPVVFWTSVEGQIGLATATLRAQADAGGRRGMR